MSFLGMYFLIFRVGKCLGKVVCVQEVTRMETKEKQPYGLIRGASSDGDRGDRCDDDSSGAADDASASATPTRRGVWAP